ncbi:hypothetical protein CVT25_001399 [Psilocybe cyanescens]|uniref:CxC1-like cysteine cluster associated with KDZ transposases domain-containing protein n=1 Tax=Psilocybe cyanescens TaxID=93625 RepID=A0A409XSK4_PSICY|nr:hypothetical protein CVT25_001399 [Psilocybe cyanescens]
MPKTTGLSKGVKITYGSGLYQQKTKITKANRNQQEIEKEREKHIFEVSERQQLFYSDQPDVEDAAGGAHDVLMYPPDDTDDEWEDEATALNKLPPGEEGFFRSHAGGEVVLQEIMEGMTFSQQYDSRTRRDHVQNRVDAWKHQTHLLTSQYLDWKRLGGSPIINKEASWNLQVISFSYFGFIRDILVPLLKSQHLHSQLIFLRSIDNSDVSAPDSAWMLLHEHYAIFIMLQPHHPPLADQLSSAYNAFLEMKWTIHWRTQDALKHGPDWDQLNICAPCLYKTKNKPLLKFSFLAAMDGNNSLKLVDNSLHWITPEDVDAFKDEVHRKVRLIFNTLASLTIQHQNPSSAPTATPPPSSTQNPASSNVSVSHPTPAGNGEPAVDPLPDIDDDMAWLNINEIDELSQCMNTCIEQWRNAGPEARKKMYALFAVAGIFLAVCQHGHVLVWRTIMKYPLAIVKHLMDTYGHDICLGYDIMCAFVKTLSRSVLGKKKVTFKLHGVVPLFHGHAHNCGCQLCWHPMYTEGVGLEDFKECEQTFCKSNELASVTCLASPYHQHQHIDKHFAFHDQDKHAVSGNFIFQNYHQALNRIASDIPQLAALSVKLKTTGTDYKAYLQAECEHLQALRSEPEMVQKAMDYLKLLTKTEGFKKESNLAADEYKKLNYNIINNGYQKKEIQARTTFTCYKIQEEELTCYEEEHDIDTHWLPDSTVYKEAQKLLVKRSYQCSVDHLKRPIVQRLFELTKLGMNGVGYKLREKINKALKTHIRSLPWTELSHQEVMNYYFGLKRAQEEIV